MTPDRPASTRRGVLGVAAGMATGLAGCVLSMEPYTATAERTFDPRDADALAVVGEDGGVTLSAGDGDRVTGTVRKESRSGREALEEATVESRVDDGTFVVEPDVPVDLNFTVHLDLAVPRSLPVERVVTDNGDVSVADVSGDATCRTQNGAVTAEGVDGYVTVESTNGDVTARDTTGVDAVSTTNGDADVDVHDVRDDVSLESTNGDVTVDVSPDLAVAVEVRTDNGDVSVQDLDLTRSESSSRRIRGRLGEDPDHTLVAETTNGSVTLRSL